MLGFLNLFSGGALTRFAVFALGIMPYITSSIIMQLLAVVIPKLEQWQQAGRGRPEEDHPVDPLPHGGPGHPAVDRPRLPVPQRRRRASSAAPASIDLIPDFTVPRVLLIVLTLTAGTAMVMWLGELITQRGIGNGMSLLIFATVVSGMPAGGAAASGPRAATSSSPSSSLIALLLLVAIVFVEQGQRRIPVQFAKRVVGRRMYGGQSTYIPLKVNQAGVIPIIFASSVLYFPVLLSNVLPSGGLGRRVRNFIDDNLLQPEQLRLHHHLRRC